MAAHEMASRVREGRFGRFAGMARAGAGVALGLLEKDPVAPLARAVDTLAELRGLGAKVGQMAGVWSAMLPEDQRRRAEPILARLRSGTTASSAEEVRRLLESELGAPTDELFAAFEDAPFASASIGQVHRAKLLDGTAVAVKVQHPGIDVALRADLDNAAHLGGVAGLLMLPAGGVDLIAEIRARFEEELDYRREADSIDRFEAITRGDPLVGVSRVVRARSSGRVLTTHLAVGLTAEAVAGGPHARASGRAVRRFFLESWLVHGLLFADPHAGNWVFHDDGRITVLDFGCVVPFERRVLEGVEGVLRAIRADDLRASHAALARLLAVDVDAAHTFAEPLRLALVPLVREGPAEAQDLARLAAATGVAKRAMLGRRVAVPVWAPLLLRALVGLISLLVTLEAPSTIG